MKDLPITMMPDGWMEKTGGYAKDMTLRDAFAMAAMQAFESRKDLDDVPLIDIAKRSYRIADAMIKAGQ